uniref:Uncharacterized protein n=1 Tax=Eutreptiella gymnastica TaxID=73025 RepID=A0A7S4GK26_9EUGL
MESRLDEGHAEELVHLRSKSPVTQYGHTSVYNMGECHSGILPRAPPVTSFISPFTYPMYSPSYIQPSYVTYTGLPTPVTSVTTTPSPTTSMSVRRLSTPVCKGGELVPWTPYAPSQGWNHMYYGSPYGAYGYPGTTYGGFSLPQYNLPQFGSVPVQSYSPAYYPLNSTTYTTPFGWSTVDDAPPKTPGYASYNYATRYTQPTTTYTPSYEPPVPPPPVLSRYAPARAPAYPPTRPRYASYGPTEKEVERNRLPADLIPEDTDEPAPPLTTPSRYIPPDTPFSQRYFSPRMSPIYGDVQSPWSVGSYTPYR